MADTTTISGLPFPEGSDANNVPSDMADLADALDGLIVRKLSTAGIAGLAAGEKPAGTYFHNSTTGKLSVSDGSAVTDYNSPTYAIGVQTTAAQSCSVGGTVIVYDGETDPSTILNSGTGTVTLPSAGVWQIDATLTLANTATSSLIMVLHNADQVGLAEITEYATTSALVVAAASDTIKLQFVNGSAGAKSVSTARLSVVRLGAA